jgi:hypothetical protein
MTTGNGDGPPSVERREHGEPVYDLMIGGGGSGVCRWCWVGRGCGWQSGHVGGTMLACAGVARPSSAAVNAAGARARVRHLVRLIGGLVDSFSAAAHRTVPYCSRPSMGRPLRSRRRSPCRVIPRSGSVGWSRDHDHRER